MKRFKTFVFQVLDEEDDAGHPLNKPVGLGIMALIALSVIAVIFESDQYLSDTFHRWFYAFEVFAVTIFTLEYLGRAWTADLKFKDLSRWQAIRRFVFSPLALIDLLAIAPFYLELALMAYGAQKILDTRFLRVLRLMRLLRLFKLNRYNQSLRLIVKVVRDEREKMVVTLFMVGILLVLSSALMFTAEHDVQPDKFPNIYTSLWWSIATITTVGYGDVYPITPGGKILAGMIALLGIGLVALPTGILASSFVNYLKDSDSQKELEEDKEEEKPPLDFCPYCGKKLPH
ncbi:MAG: ion transporter [Saprospirales bacterium]|nr:ion transporter [Saprospirales bacterium]